MLSDEAIAFLVRATGLPLDVLFFGGYVLSMALLWAAIVSIGRAFYSSTWLTIALGAALTLRHRIPKTSANSFEPYFHPRMLAFALGALAVAAVLRRRFWLAIALVAVTAVAHVTTGLWFAVLIGAALVTLDRTLRALAIAGSVAAAAFLAWALTAGPLHASFVTMDGPWLEAVSGKDSLLASQWPAWAWFANLAMLAIAWAAHRARVRSGAARVEERGILWGATALVALFLVTFPAVVARFALPVQLQIPRVFWLVDFVAVLLAIGVVQRPAMAKALAIGLGAIAVGRGVYVAAIEHPERELFAIHLPADDWQDAMRWLQEQPLDTHVLADPGHAWKYGTSVRVSAERDVFLEDVKDSAVAIYSRDVALRYLDRSRAAADFDQMSAERARALAAKYDLDYLVVEADLPLPIAYRNNRFRVYALH